MTDPPSTTRYFLLICMALILAACHPQPGAAAPSTPTATSAHTPTSTPVVLENGWYVYTDPEGEFSFAYPPTAIISAGQNPVDLSKNILVQFLIPDQPYQGMSIRIEPNPKRLSAADLARQLYERSAQKPATAEFTNSLQPIQVGGISAVQASIPSSNTELTIIIPYDMEFFTVSPVHDLANTKVEQETLDLFYQILNTMKFGSSQ